MKFNVLFTEDTSLDFKIIYFSVSPVTQKFQSHKSKYR